MVSRSAVDSGTCYFKGSWSAVIRFRKDQNMARKKRFTIKSVSFRSNVNIDGKYNHAHVEASADVPSGVNPQLVLDELKDFVAQELRRAKEGEPVPVVKTSGRFRV